MILKCCIKKNSKKNKGFLFFFDLIFGSGFPEIFSRKKSLKADVVRVAVDGGFVGAGLNLLWLLGSERVLSTVPDVYLQLCQYLEGGLELCLTAETKEESGHDEIRLMEQRELRCLRNDVIIPETGV